MSFIQVLYKAHWHIQAAYTLARKPALAATGQAQSASSVMLVFLASMQTLFKEGLKGIYKGMGAPLATVALFNAVLFASRGQMQVLLSHKDGEALSKSMEA